MAQPNEGIAIARPTSDHEICFLFHYQFTSFNLCVCVCSIWFSFVMLMWCDIWHFEVYLFRIHTVNMPILSILRALILMHVSSGSTTLKWTGHSNELCIAKLCHKYINSRTWIFRWKVLLAATAAAKKKYASKRTSRMKNWHLNI